MVLSNPSVWVACQSSHIRLSHITHSEGGVVHVHTQAMRRWVISVQQLYLLREKSMLDARQSVSVANSMQAYPLTEKVLVPQQQTSRLVSSVEVQID